MDKIQVNIESKINEIFATTKVTQTFINNNEDLLELEVIINKQINNINFSSFHLKIGDSMEFHSKIIESEKSQEINDGLESSEKFIVYSIHYNENEIIVHIDNLPPKQNLIFISEYIQLIESVDNNYEYELFRSIPLIKFISGDEIGIDTIKSSLEIKAEEKIKKIEKKFLSNNINIKEELFDENKNIFKIKYEYDYNSIKKVKDLFTSEKEFENYLKNNKTFFKINKNPTNKIYFQLESNAINLYSQISSKNINETSYLFNYKSVNKSVEEDTKLNPALFIFLVSQKEADSQNESIINTLLLCLQSLPKGSYYQIVPLKTNYKLIDEIPKEYNYQNLKKTISRINLLETNEKKSDLYTPLNYIYSSEYIKNNILLPKHIFLLVTNKIKNKNETLELIDKYRDNFTVYSIGFGNDYDKDLVENIGIIGKGNHSFCKHLEDLNQIIISKINNICCSFNYMENIKITSSLDKLNIYNLHIIKEELKQNRFYNFYKLFYITEQKKEEKDKNYDFTIKYKQNGKDCVEKYEKIKLREKFPGEEISKLILIKYVLNNPNILYEEKIKLALKYQILIEGSSILIEDNSPKKIMGIISQTYKNSLKDKNNEQSILKDPFDSGPLDSQEFQENDDYPILDDKPLLDEFEMLEKKKYGKNKNNNDKNIKDLLENINYYSEDVSHLKNKENDSKLNLGEIENVKMIIKCQNFIEGFFSINKKTEILKEKYKNEFNLLKQFKDKNIDDIVAMTIIIVYFVNKEHPELIPELIMIIKKAKLYVESKTGISYENLIKKFGL